MKTIKVFFALFLLLSISSCAAMDPITSTGYSLLLVKAQELIALCCLLLNQSEVYHGQVISRLYYSYYHMARLLHINIHGYDAGGHAKTWKNLSNKELETFGIKMKALREKYDYDAIDLSNISDSNLREDFGVILAEKDNAFKLIDNLKKTLKTCSYLNQEEKEDCEKIIDNIKDNHESLMKEIKNKYALKDEFLEVN